MALVAAVDTEAALDRARVLVDDLGWASHLLGQDAVALENIQRGIEIATAQSTQNASDIVEMRLTAAKGYRHMAMMTQREEDGHRFLDRAEEVITSLRGLNENVEHFKDALVRDKAQIDHARATILARSLGVLNHGSDLPKDRESTKKAMDALALVSAATTSFESIADYERLNKGLVLEERLLTALGRRTAALEIHAKRQKVARTLSVRNQ